MSQRGFGQVRALLRRLDPARLLTVPALNPATSTTAPVDAPLQSPAVIVDGARPARVQPESIDWGTSPTAYTFTRDFQATCAKDLTDPASNEDATLLRLGQDRAAVFDGASESFAARRWARQVAHRWGRSTSPGWLAQARGDYAQHVDALAKTWAQEVAAERGSYTTIAAVTLTPAGLSVTTVGDSCVFLLDQEEIVWSHPFTSEEQFTSAPQALSTRPDLTEDDDDALIHGTLLIQPARVAATHVMLATDAVSAWLLTDDPDQRRKRTRQLLASRSGDDFATLVADERTSGRLKVDDTTVLVLTLEPVK